MNTGNFAGMARPHMGQPQPHMGLAQMGQAVMAQPQHMIQQAQLPAQILAYLRNHHVPNGWQQTYRLEQRVSVIMQILTQLSLVRPMPMEHAFKVAREFEAKAFEKSPDQASYEGEYTKKLQQLMEARQQTAAQMQQMQNLQNGQQALGGQPMQKNFMAPNPQNIQLPWSGPNMPRPSPNGSMSMQQMQVQNTAQQPMGGMANSQQSLSNGHPRPNPQPVASSNMKPVFTDQDQSQISNLMQQIMQNMTQLDKAQIAKTAAEMDPHMKQVLAARGMNPMAYIVRHQATQTFMQQRNMLGGQAAGRTTMPGGGGAVPHGMPHVQPSPAMGHQTNQFEAAGNMNHILGQQQNALRHQQAGEVVVPANTGQRGSSRVPNASQQSTQHGPFTTNGNRPVPNIGGSGQAAGWSTQQGPASNPLQNSQMHAQQQVNNFGNTHRPDAQQNSFMNQDGSLNTTMSHQTSQHNRVMPTLNQAMNPPSQTLNVPSPARGQSTLTNGQRTTNGMQASASNEQPTMNTNLNKTQQFSMPPAMQQHLQSLNSDEERRQFIMEMRRKQFGARQQSQLNGSQSTAHNIVAQQSSQRAPQAPMGNFPHTQGAGDQNVLNGSMTVDQQGNLTNQAAQQLGSRMRMGQGRTALTEEQTREMDPEPFPGNLLNNNQTLSQLPDYVKTWGQLKSWVANNAHSLPEHSAAKLQILQVRHYEMTRHDQSQHQITSNHKQTNGLTSQVPGPAPPAQMFPPGGPHASTTPIAFPPVPPPTMQEIESMKARIPATLVPRPNDDQIRNMVMKLKHEQRLRAAGAQQRDGGPDLQALQQQQYNNMMRSQQTQLSGSRGIQTGPETVQPAGQPLGQQRRGQQYSKTPATQPTRPNQPHESGQNTNFPGLKRTNTDDVIEVPDPNAARPQPMAHQLSGQGFTQAQIDAMPPQQRQQHEAFRRLQFQRGLEMQQRNQSKQGHGPMPSAARNNNQNHPINLKVRQLREEVMRTVGPRQSQSMTSKERDLIIDELKTHSALLNRIDDALPAFLGATGDEAKLKGIIRAQALVVAQLRDGDHTPVENFTVTLGELRQSLQMLMAFVHFVMKLVAIKRRQTTQTQMDRLQHTPAKSQTQATAQTKPQPLNAANLQQQQEALQHYRAASAQKTQANKPPDPPTTTHAPFSFGSQSPQGIPQIYNPQKNELTQDKLVLPVSKKRKNNQRANASTIPVQGQNNASSMKASASSKNVSTDAQRVQSSPSIKCTVADCKASPFTTKAHLEKHVKDAHEVKDEQITDPLEYVLVGLREVLNLDADGKSKPVESRIKTESLPASTTKPLASSQGSSVVKEEDVTPSSKTMAGIQTPQAKVPTPTLVSDKKPGAIAKAQTTAVADAWAGAKISKGWFQVVFHDVQDPNGAVGAEILTEWLSSTNASSANTTPSTDDKDSPRAIEATTSDKLDINMANNTADRDRKWLPAEWFDHDLPGEFENLDMDNYLDGDWDMMSVQGQDSIDRKRKEMDPSDEWLKVWAPEKLKEQVKKTSTKRK